MSDEIDRPEELDTEDRRLADLFRQVEAPASMRRWGGASPGHARRGGLGSRLVAALIGAAGERRLRPLAAALVLPVLVLAVGGGLGLRAHFSGTGGSLPNPPARSDAAMAFDADHGVVVMFGGRDRGGDLGDTWTWDGDSWTQQHPATSPSARSGAAMAYDAAHHIMVMFGGYQMGMYSPNSGPQQETWTWDGSTWHRVATAHQPAALEAGMAFDQATGQLVLVASGFGVATATVSNGLNVGRAPAGLPPNHGSTVVPGPGMGATVGGGSTSLAVPLHPQVNPVPVPAAIPQMLSSRGVTTWTWSGSDWVRHAAGSPPSDAAGQLYPAWNEASRRVDLVTSAPMQVCSFGEAMVQSGPGKPAATGSAASGSAVRWSGGVALPAPSHVATPVMPATPMHPVPVPPSMCGTTVPMNVPTGCPSSCSPIHQWRWDGAAWHEVTPSGSAPGPHVVSDPSTGGLIDFTPLTTAELKGGVWTHHANPADLMRRSGSALAGDAARKVVVLFGGLGRGGYGSDTWVWAGEGWTHRAGALPPVPTPYAIPQPNIGGPPGAVCNIAPTVTVARQAPAGTVITVSQRNPVICGLLVVQLVDRDTSAPLDVRGNSIAMGGELVHRLVWLNWCGTAAVDVNVKEPNGGLRQRVTDLPACTNRSLPSTLTLGPAGAQAIP